MPAMKLPAYAPVYNICGGKKMKIVLSVLIGAFVIMGILLSLIAIYASPDNQIHFLEASYFWIADAIAIFGIITLFKKSE